MGVAVNLTALKETNNYCLLWLLIVDFNLNKLNRGVNMQIQKFNPTLFTLEEFNAILKPETPQEEVKSATFIALSRLRYEDLISNKRTYWVRTITGYAQERAQKISHTILSLNNLCELKDSLKFLAIGKNAPFKEMAGQALEEIFAQKDQPDFFDRLEKITNKWINTKTDLDRSSKASLYQGWQLLNQHDITIERQKGILNRIFLKIDRTKFLDQIEEMKKEYKDCDFPVEYTKTLEEIKRAYESCNLPLINSDLLSKIDSQNNENLLKLIDYFCNALTVNFLKDENANFEEIKTLLYRDRYPVTNETKEILDKQLLIAKEKAIVIKGKDLEALPLKELKVIFGHEITFRKKYDEYAERKKVVYDALNKLSSFCLIDELSCFPKITKESELRIKKFALKV